jgi:hypothetical protein
METDVKRSRRKAGGRARRGILRDTTQHQEFEKEMLNRESATHIQD